MSNPRVSINRLYFSIFMIAVVAAIVLGTLSLSTAQSANSRAPLAVPIGQWSPTTLLPQPLAAWNAIVHQDAVYMIGGRNGAEQPIKEVYYAKIQSTGQLGTWVSTQALPIPLYLHSVSADENYVYVVGGWSGSKTESSVWRAPFNANGGLGTWISVGTYPVTIDLHGSVIANNRLYVFGGWNGLQPLSNVYYAETAAGGLGEWQAAPALPAPLYRLAVTVYNDVVYVTGGYDNNRNTYNSVFYAHINADGSLSAWQTTTPMPNALYYHRLIIHDGQLVVLGGKNDNAEFSNVYSASINGDGTISNWVTQPSLPQPIYRFAAVSVKLYESEFIYVLGGVNGAAVLNTVYHSEVPPPPTPTPTPPAIALNIRLENRPAHWIAPNAEIEYAIRYENNTDETVSNVTLENFIPENTELVDNSLQPDGVVSSSGATSSVQWTFDKVSAGDSGEVSYRVRRIPPTATPSTAPPSGLSIKLSGPASVSEGDTIRYQFTITNEVPIDLDGIVVTNELPFGAAYVDGSGGELTGNVVRWTLPSMPADILGPPRIPSTATFEYAVTADHTIVNSIYRVDAKPPSGSGPGPVGLGRQILVTQVGDSVPEGPGDGLIIVNNGAAITWEYNGQVSTTPSNTVRNPGLQKFIYLPVAKR